MRRPDPQIIKHHHYHTAGFDLEFIDWQLMPNPNPFHSCLEPDYLWVGTRKIIKDAHKELHNELP